MDDTASENWRDQTTVEHPKSYIINDAHEDKTKVELHVNQYDLSIYVSILNHTSSMMLMKIKLRWKYISINMINLSISLS